MTPTEHTPKPPHSTGGFAVLCGLLRVKGSGASSPGRRLGVAGLLALGVLLFVAASASAGEVHIYGSSFGGAGSGSGQFKEPQGVAVNDETGDVYVADRGNDRIEQFTSSGTFIAQFDGAGAPSGALEKPTWVAVDNCTTVGVRCSKLQDESVGDVYVTGEVEGGAHHVIYKFSESGAYLGQIATGEGGAPFSELDGIAVDPAGELWVYQSTNEVDNYTDAAVNVFAEGRKAEVFGLAAGPGFAVGPEDDLYTAIAAPAGDHLLEFNSAGEYLSEPVNGRAGITAAAVNPSNDELYELYVQNESAVISVFAGASEHFGSEHLSAGSGIAVNASSNSVYVADATSDTVSIFDAADVPVAGSEPATGVEVTHEAGHAVVTATLNGTVNPGGLPVTSCEFEYGTSASYGQIAKCRQSEAEIGEGTSPVSVSANVTSLLPDTTYHFRLLAANRNDESSPSIVSRYAGLDETFPTPGPSVVSEAPASEVTAATAALSGEVNPGGLPLSECEFEYVEAARYKPGTAYPYAAGGTVPCEPGTAAIGEGTAPVSVHADLAGLLGGTEYRVRLAVATEVFSSKETASATGPGQAFTTAPVPVVAGAEATDLTATSAVLRATVDPEGVQVTHCAFEYGTSTSYGETAKCEQKKSAIGAGTEPVPVSATLTELQSGTEYHWRLVVTDQDGSSLQAPGGAADHTFIHATTGTELPDDRAYEMVTPPFKNGAAIGYAFSGYGPQVSGDGSRVIALSIQCFAGSRSCDTYSGEFAEPFAFSRTASGWTTTPLAPPATTFPENTQWEVSANTGDALFSMPTGSQHEEEWYREGEAGSFERIGPVTPPGSSGTESFRHGARQATADFSHLVWEMKAPYWPFDSTSFISGISPESTPGSLYEYTGSREGVHNEAPFLVAVTGARGSDELISTCKARLGNGQVESSNALSADGRVVFFTALPKSTGTGAEGICPGSGANASKQLPVAELYARVDGEEPTAHTVAISQPDAPQVASEAARGRQSPPDQSCTSVPCTENIEKEGNWRPATFAGASADGSRVFFLDTQQLTDAATQGTGPSVPSDCSSSSDCNLYLYDFNRPAGHNLLDVSETAEHTSVSGGPRVQGVVAISADGSHVYFVAQGKLASNRDALGDQAVQGEDNLYVFDTETGQLAFIATEPATFTDTRSWLDTGLFANVTPEGRFLVFESSGDLTPDDTRSDGSAQIFRYDAETEELTRISIGNDGFNDNGNASVPASCANVDTEGKCTGDATIVHAAEGRTHAGPARGDPTMSNDGAYVFFQSPLALTPHALDDVQIALTEGKPGYAENVYEWHEGHVYLISDGHDTATAATPCSGISVVCLLGADETGHNVFFTTTDRLVPKDTDTQLDIYDARICEPENGNPCISEPAPPTPPCDGENCHGIPAATPSLLAPGTATFNGEGNTPSSSPPPAVKPKALTRAQKLTKALKACAKDKKKSKRVACEKQAKKTYGVAKKAKKSAHINRRAK